MRRSLLFIILLLSVGTPAQQPRRASETRSRTALTADSHLTGVYRINIAESDRLYSVISGATSTLPFAEQQRFFIDLAARLTPPDLLAIERHGRRINIASSRAPRFSFEADDVTRSETDSTGRIVQTRAALHGDQLTVTSNGGTNDRFMVVFDPGETGNRLRVTRRIYAEGLNQPVTIRSVYDRISEVAQWSIYGEPLTASKSAPVQVTSEAEDNEAGVLRNALNDWIAATNARDINSQMGFYMPTLKAFYLTRNVQQSFVRAEKVRVFQRARSIDVRAEEPEILFNEAGQSAIMRFRKRYAIEGGPQSRRGEVVQELRWQKTREGWRIISERDIRVLR